MLLTKIYFQCIINGYKFFVTKQARREAMGKYSLSWADIRRMDGLHPEERNDPGVVKQVIIGLLLAGGVLALLWIGAAFGY